MKTVLELKNYSLSFDSPEGEVQAVREVNLTLGQGEILTLVGESGCGKTVLCKSILKLLPKNARIKSGQILLNGEDITSYKERQMQKIRGRSGAMVFQDPMTSLNPTIPVGRQIMEAVLRCEKIDRAAAKQRALELMELVGIEQPRQRFDMQPHFFSGGMRQRCVLAAALAANPKVLLADEPTTALDVTVQARILDLLLEVRDKTGIGMILVSHDLGVVARVADRVAVMYAGKIVETGTSKEVFYEPAHPYTWGLLSAMPANGRPGEKLFSIPGMPPSLACLPKGDAFAPRNPCALAVDFQAEPPMYEITPTHHAATWLLDPRSPKVKRPDGGTWSGGKPGKEAESVWTAAEKGESRERSLWKPSCPAQGEEARPGDDIILEVKHLKQYFPISRSFTVRAVDDVSFTIKKGEIFGLVGESGCGKSTAARSVMGLYQPTGGEIYYKGNKISDKKIYRANRMDIQKNMQIIFQDSAAALNPRMRVFDSIAEPLRACRMIADKAEEKQRIENLLEQVGLNMEFAGRRPGEISGGQRQRTAIARSLATIPDLIVADEPIASLDLSIQAQILNLFQKLQKEYGFSFLFIAHDLAVVRHICDRIGVMLRGKLVEMGTVEQIFEAPLHPYTQALLSAVPVADPDYERKKQILFYDPETLPGDGVMEEEAAGHWVYRG